MSETPPYSAEPSSHSATPTSDLGGALRSLRRSSSNRMVAGILGGLGERFRIDPVLLRVATAVLALFGGVGVLLYALAWLLVPSDDADGSIVEQALGRVETRTRHSAPAAIGLALIVLISVTLVVSGSLVSMTLLVLAAAGVYAIFRNSWRDDEGEDGGNDTSDANPDIADDEYPRSWPHPDDEPGPPELPWPPAAVPEAATATPAPAPAKRAPVGAITICVTLVVLGAMAVNDATWAAIPVALYLAVALAIIGLGLVIGSFFGRSHGLIALGIVVSLALFPAAWLGEWNGGVGDMRLSADTVAELPDDTVEHGIGDLRYDLSELTVRPGEEAAVSIEMGVGDMTVLVPPEVTLEVDIGIGLGSATVRDNQLGGAGNEFLRRYTGDDPDAGTLVLHLDLGLGDITVEDR